MLLENFVLSPTTPNDAHIRILNTYPRWNRVSPSFNTVNLDKISRFNRETYWKKTPLDENQYSLKITPSLYCPRRKVIQTSECELLEPFLTLKALQYEYSKTLDWILKLIK
ncbi:hypothetical protein BpHYR1_042063 [Brachionus plicatilis]|uniref:Uncharacterized protein n=1 Tax=Brachionus plicatilis TaxID=10195 RepID=A0A3M7SIN9_BRAPC|nr:hypothetical protein BpHYR1_042063 [Brachionus plicatilis]